ncbi:NAD(P)/FAD-dependent oxidoreductase [Candidatus Neptunochlamydia vexilliferae]|uniref:FAD dependent oxidoreductase domain-containing protein n=1 Tax=Candidatus Neptunichlamydia vexilliferae TaxID=1651774 RepID=A0ABS0B168_9BACT|nr:FAD-dependent oxidoreductase [Candidatus Neptunochlamydia vexilliferae]MBF5059421.1 hypothetical protein [Candidatus Neptunochlamydia vexilliferae]
MSKNSNRRVLAIVGGGFSGLALCYYLLKKGGDVTLFDGGGGASKMASGLLHPYPGESAFLSWKGIEGMKETRALLERVGPEVYKETGILRFAVSEKQRKAFKQRAEEKEDVEWWDKEKCHAAVPGSAYLPGIFIRSGITVHAKAYLEGLWKICEDLGGHLEKKKVDLDDLQGFDRIILAAGGGIRSFAAAKKLDLRFTKGQLLVCKKPHYFTGESSVTGKGYLALSENNDQCYLGSTYERNHTTEAPCLGTATDLIFNQIGQFIPSYGSFEVKGCLAEMRVSTKDYRPFIGKIDENIYAITGMGSRGLLYHAYFGKKLAEEVMGCSSSS